MYTTAPALPRDVMMTIARAALAARGNGLRAWAQLSLVCAAWRQELRGAVYLAGTSIPSRHGVRRFLHSCCIHDVFTARDRDNIPVDTTL